MKEEESKFEIDLDDGADTIHIKHEDAEGDIDMGDDANAIQLKQETQDDIPISTAADGSGNLNIGVNDEGMALSMKHDLDSAENIRTNTLHITGVDNLSTEEVRKYIKSHGNVRRFQLEWIDDTSVNINLFTPQAALQVIMLLAVSPPVHDPQVPIPEPVLPGQQADQQEILDAMRKSAMSVSALAEAQYDISSAVRNGTMANIDSFFLTERRAISFNDNRSGDQNVSAHGDLYVRYATKSDVKAKGARQQSRYYLIHGEPTVEDDLIAFGSIRNYDAEEQQKIRQESNGEDGEGDDILSNKILRRIESRSHRRNPDETDGKSEQHVDKDNTSYDQPYVSSGSLFDRIESTSLTGNGDEKEARLHRPRPSRSDGRLSALDSSVFRSRKDRSPRRDRSRSRSPGFEGSEPRGRRREFGQVLDGGSSYRDRGRRDRRGGGDHYRGSSDTWDHSGYNEQNGGGDGEYDNNDDSRDDDRRGGGGRDRGRRGFDGDDDRWVRGDLLEKQNEERENGFAAGAGEAGAGHDGESGTLENTGNSTHSNSAGKSDNYKSFADRLSIKSDGNGHKGRRRAKASDHY